MAIDESKLNEFLDRFVTDIGATVVRQRGAFRYMR